MVVSWCETGRSIGSFFETRFTLRFVPLKIGMATAPIRELQHRAEV